MKKYTVLLRIDAHIEIEANSAEEAERIANDSLSIWAPSDDILFDHIEVESVSTPDDPDPEQEEPNDPIEWKEPLSQ